MLQIQMANSADAGEISRLINRLSQPFYLNPDRSTAEKFLASIGTDAIGRYISSPEYLYLVAKDGTTTAGFVAMRGRSHLFHLFVDDSYQGRGLARQLWNEARRRVTQSGGLSEFTVNASLNAVIVYERFGFQSEGEVRQVNGISFQPMRLAVMDA
ncbi:GNAT family N-acetyltransferase [Comamonas testosteroni]|uniref:GNAT family N-acetyltransferase n=1 Tax=Comamonas testosteroni TaxID=285 RepID=UPI002DBD7AC2|nr:GNAT family N-acetyltransferase [Comamonas testosteroni]MEB5963884.1 GNAT family N-acetyltransferase [Comamonas testosteroni]